MCFLSAGAHPSQERGTASFMSIPAGVQISPSAKAVWKAELDSSSSPELGILKLTLTPPADAPVGEFMLVGHYSGEEQLLAMLVVLFNPWCPGRSTVHLYAEKKAKPTKPQIKTECFFMFWLVWVQKPLG